MTLPPTWIVLVRYDDFGYDMHGLFATEDEARGYAEKMSEHGCHCWLIDITITRDDEPDFDSPDQCWVATDYLRALHSPWRPDKR